jgi:hypothetical protein
MAGTAMTCEKFEAILPDYFEGDLNDEAKAAADEHAKTCKSCSAIVTDINRLTTEAAALPAMKPARDLWSGIESRISAPIIPLAQTSHRGARSFGSAWMAAAAAALVVTTAGITYLATTRGVAKPPAQVAVVTPTRAAPIVDSTAVTPTVTSPGSDQTPGVAAQRVNTSSANLASNNAGNRRTPVTVVAAGSFGSPQEEAAYAKEINVLERMVNSANSGLDPATVQIVKKNLQIIDDAIAQSKAALAKDPASPLLYNQVTRAMGKKIELLRTMASLSSST